MHLVFTGVRFRILILSQPLTKPINPYTEVSHRPQGSKEETYCLHGKDFVH